MTEAGLPHRPRFIPTAAVRLFGRPCGRQYALWALAGALWVVIFLALWQLVPRLPRVIIHAGEASFQEAFSPTQEYLSMHPLPANRERLLTLFSEAQRAFLEKSSEESSEKFKSLLALLTEDDWDKSDREIFLQAYLRLAQMESDAERRERWLGLSLLLGAVNFDADLFPPPLLTKRAEIGKHLPKKQVVRKFFAAGWNGS